MYISLSIVELIPVTVATSLLLDGVPVRSQRRLLEGRIFIYLCSQMLKINRFQKKLMMQNRTYENSPSNYRPWLRHCEVPIGLRQTD